MASAVSLEEELRHAETYEDYLDSFITEADRTYLQDEQMARQLVEIGCLRGTVLSREEFYAKAEALDEQQRSAARSGRVCLFSPGASLCPLKCTTLVRQLFSREELLRSGCLSSIVFVRDFNAKGHEISGYMDLADRLKAEDFPAVLDGRKRLLPRPGDLSYYNWRTGVTRVKDSSHFLVLTGETAGILFRHKRDRKLLNPDPYASPGDNTKRLDVDTPELLQVVIFDHTCRKKT